MKEGRIDTSMAISTLTNVVIRKTGSNIDWDGRRFSGLTHPVLIGSGLVATKNKMTKLGVEIYDSAKSVPQMLNMLLSERAQVAIVRDTDAKEWIVEGPFQGKVEILPVPAYRLFAFLGFNNHYFAQRLTVAQGMWLNMAYELKQDISEPTQGSEY